VRSRGFEVGEAGIFFGGGALLGGIFGSLLGGRLADWRRNARPAGELDVSVAAGLLAVPLIVLTTNTFTPWLFLATGIAAFIVIYACFPALNAFLVARVPNERRGLATAINVFFMGGIGSAAGPFVVGLTSDLTGSLHTALLTPAIGLSLAIVLIAAAGRAARAEEAAGATASSVKCPPDAA
jgi:predicted MFS family arabinose efflux permease